GRKRMSHMTIDLTRDTESFAQRFRNLPDVRYLFHRRTDERGQAFPFWLPNDPQPATKITGSIHRRVIGKRSANGRERMIESEIMCDDSGERRRLAIADFQRLATLFHVNRDVPDRPRKSVVDFVPMKDLPRVERHREIEVRRVNFRQFHFSPQINTDETGI